VVVERWGAVFSEGYSANGKQGVLPLPAMLSFTTHFLSNLESFSEVLTCEKILILRITE